MWALGPKKENKLAREVDSVQLVLTLSYPTHEWVWLKVFSTQFAYIDDLNAVESYSKQWKLTNEKFPQLEIL